jgi:peptide/nickel transport system permease protein
MSAMHGTVGPTAITSARRRAPMPWDVRIAAGLLGITLAVALLADVITPFGYATQDLGARLRPPVFIGGDWRYPLGTDNLGRDILSRLIYGVRTSILIAFGATAIGATLGILLGLLAARLRGVFEEAVLMLVDVQAAIPSIIVALAALAFFGNNLLLFIFLIGLEGWERYARLTRGLVLSAKEAGYVTAIQSLGACSPRLYLRHILPNIASALIVQATLNFPTTVLLETSLSFLGLGVQPPLPSWGLMISEAKAYMFFSFWLIALPGTALALLIFAINLTGDGLRDVISPEGRT